MKLQTEKEKPTIDYNIFQKVILDFQLRSHEKFLKNFVSLFRSVDKDLNGIIDEVNKEKSYSIYLIVHLDWVQDNVNDYGEIQYPTRCR